MGLKYEIESLRQHAAIQGYVITELTDIYWESNGLMDMERNLRAFHEPFAHLNADLVVLPGFGRWAYWTGERIDFAPRVATGGATLAPGAVVEWELQPYGVSGSVASSMVLSTSTKGTCATTAPHKSGSELTMAPISSPPAEPPDVAIRPALV